MLLIIHWYHCHPIVHLSHVPHPVFFAIGHVARKRQQLDS